MAPRIPSKQDDYNKTVSSIFSYTNGKLEAEKDPFVQAISKVINDITDDLYKTISDSTSQTFSQTATDESFIKANAYDKTRNTIQRKEAKTAQGQLIVTSTTSIDVPVDTLFVTNDSEIYSSLTLKTTNLQQFLITSIQRISNFAVVTLADHNFASILDLTISGATPSSFNGDYPIEILDKDTFRYPNAGINEVATGTIIGSYFGARIDVQSQNASEEVNKTFTNEIIVASNINLDNAYITFNGITGGRAIETLTDYNARIIEFLSNPENKGNLNQHRSYIKQKTDVNFVYFFTSEDALYIYLTGVISKYDKNFTFSNYSVNELNDIKAQFIFDNQLLLGVDALQLSITNPSFVNIDITITDLIPNTLEMRDIINLLLKEYIAKLPIKFYLNAGFPELSSDKIKSIINLARNGAGQTPNITSVVITGTGGLTNNISKPILGAVTYA